MITKDNFKAVLKSLGFVESKNKFTKKFGELGDLGVDFDKQKLIYPSGLTINNETTCNFSSAENFVVFECVHRLLEKGYKPNDIEL